MTQNHRSRVETTIASAQTREAIVRSEGRLAFLRTELAPETALVFCRGQLDYWVYDPHALSRGRCRLKVTVSGQTLFSGSVNLDSLQTRRRLARSEIAPKTPLETADAIESDLMLLSDMARQQWAEQLGGKSAEGYVMTAGEEQEAMTLAKDPMLLERLDDILGRLGLVGEHRNRIIVYLALVSRVLMDPVSVMMRGESAAGKSYLVKTVLSLMPAEAYEELTEATAKSFYYLPDDCLRHRFVVICEQPGSEAADYTIRVLQSEGKIVIQTTVKDPRTGNFKTQKKTLLGPVGFITTTTRATINFENDTRLLPLYVDETEQQTKRIIMAYASGLENRQSTTSPQEILLWQNLQRCLRPNLGIIIPFASRIAEDFPTAAQRVRRDFARTMALLSTIALLCQHQRNIKTDEQGEYIEATIGDYAIARFLLEGPMQRAISDLNPRSIRILNHCIINRTDNTTVVDQLGIIVEHGPRPQEFTYTDLARAMHWRRSTVQKWIEPLVENGYLQMTEDTKSGGRGRKNRYVLNSSPENLQVFTDLGILSNWLPPTAWRSWPSSDDGLAALVGLWATVASSDDASEEDKGCEI